MQDPTSTATAEFSPQLGDVYVMLGICGMGFVILVWLAFRLNKIANPDPRRKVLLPMLAYFMALLALMGFLGSFWSLFKYPDVGITDKNMFIDGEAYPKPRPHEIRLENYSGNGLNSSTRVLLIQTKDRKTWAFPDDRYPVNVLMNRLRGE